MNAGNENLLAMDVGGFRRELLVLASGDQGYYVDETKKSKDEKGCPKDFGPRGSGEAAKGGRYHRKSEG